MNNKRKLFQFCHLCAAVLMLSPLVQAQYLYTTNADNTLTITDYNGASSVAVVPGSFNGQLVTGISDGAFEAGMYSILIPASITNIMDYAFALNPYLTNVTFEGNAPSADPTVFYGDTTVTVYYMAGTTGWGSRFDGLPTAPSAFSFAIQNGSVTITGYTGASGPLTIPAAIFELPVTTIAGYSFDEDLGNTSPTSVTIPNSVTSLQSAAFQQAYTLTTVSIGSGVTNIGSQDVFLVCFALTNITVDALNPNYCSANGVLFNKEKTVLLQYPIGAAAESYTIPASVTAIGYQSFDYAGDTLYGGGNLRNVIFPSGVSNIADGAFGNSGVSAVFFSGNAPTVDTTAFGGDSVKCYFLPGTTGWSNFAAAANVQVALWNPLIQSGGPGFGVISNQFGFNITGTNNCTVAGEACTNLVNPVWVPLQTCTLTNGSFYFTDSQWTNYACRFYGLGFP